MARDGNGNYTKAEADFVGGSVINATSMNNNFDDIAVALTNSIAKNGETKITGDIDFNSNKAVNVKDATASADATNLKVIQNRVGVHGISSGTNTITLTLSPAISNYVAGQEFTFKAGGTNTGATTLNINAKGAKNVLTQQGLALTANSIVANKFYKVRYDGTSFILLDDIPMNVLTEKTTLVDNDIGVIEDSEATNAKKKFKLSSVWTYIKSKALGTFRQIRETNLTVTVGTGGDYAEIADACYDLYNKYYPKAVAGGLEIKVNCLSGYIMKNPLVIINGINMGFITITSVDSEVEMNMSGVSAFYAANSCCLPTVNCLFNGNNKAIYPVTLMHNSHILFLENSGIKNCAGYVGVMGNSRFTVERGKTALFTGLTGSGYRSLIVTDSGFASLEKSSWQRTVGTDRTTDINIYRGGFIVHASDSPNRGGYNVTLNTLSSSGYIISY